MPGSEAYDRISEKVAALKRDFPTLRNRPDEYAFSALCVRANFYKNPALDFQESDIENIVVDGQYDGGVDAMLLDPNDEGNDMILVQSKYYKTISFEDVRDAVQKLILFYKEMDRGEYQNVNEKVQRRFLTLNAEVGEESKIRFVFYTSAKKSGIRIDRIERLVREHFQDTSKFEISVLFADDIIEEIKELESRRPTVESGIITIDEKDNFLSYGEDAVIVNASAFSIKELYAIHNTNLLSKNLRYYIRKKEIDQSISGTIRDEPEQFWYRNNGLTIICSKFDVDGKIVHLKDFSIVNGGQTTTLLHKSKNIDKEHDLYLPCKIIQAVGNTDNEKSSFILEIAKATNSQKPIKQIDLKANAPEQIRFSNAMREAGIYYQTKRGEKVPREYEIDYLNTDLAEVGKLCLAGVFQLPAASRNKPSQMYHERFYEVIFNRNQAQVSSIIKELLYIDYFFRKKYINEFDRRHANDIVSPIAFAHNARTVCIAFTAFVARYKSGNLDNEKIRTFFAHRSGNRVYDDYLYQIFSDLGDVRSLYPANIFRNKDFYDRILTQLFDTIILSGHRYFRTISNNDSSISETNFLKNDQNYYAFLSADWFDISQKIDQIYDGISNFLQTYDN